MPTRRPKAEIYTPDQGQFRCEMAPFNIIHAKKKKIIIISDDSALRAYAIDRSLERRLRLRGQTATDSSSLPLCLRREKPSMPAMKLQQLQCNTDFFYLSWPKISPCHVLITVFSARTRHLDFINVMTFDFHGHWEGVIGHHSPLYRGSKDGGDSIYSNVVSTPL